MPKYQKTFQQQYFCYSAAKAIMTDDRVLLQDMYYFTCLKPKAKQSCSQFISKYDQTSQVGVKVSSQKSFLQFKVFTVGPIHKVEFCAHAAMLLYE